jgi:hypothetical protein
MSEKPFTLTELPGQGDEQAWLATWTGLANGDTGAPLPDAMLGFADRCVQVSGTFGTGGNCRIEGSNDGGTTYATLHDPGANALNIATAGLSQVLEMARTMRPNITAGDGTTSLTVRALLRRTKR